MGGFEGVLGAIIAIGTVAGAIGGAVALWKHYEARRAGQTAARLVAAEREAERAKSRERIESDIRKLDAAGLERLLNDDSD